ncbi:MAG TPA: hypothetical protein VFW15_12440, partial [Thermoanaerobaculia bacterium]|nr:hypothetical protein [Thermoanaerobaculia bacterium]
MRLLPILHWIGAGVGMLLLARTLGASRWGSWVAAVTYTFSGVGVSEVFFPNIQPGMALLPWVVWGAAYRSARPVRKAVLLSLLFALDFLAGDVFTVGMAIGCCLLWIAIGIGKGERLRELAVLASAIVLAALAAAPQIAATAMWVPETRRAILEMKLGEALSFSPSPLRMLELFVPYPFGATASLESSRIWGWPVFHSTSMGFFTTFYSGAFAVIALAVTRRFGSPGDRFAWTLFLVALVVIVFPGFLPASWADLPSPLPLRYPEKFAVVLILALGIAAGLSFERLRSARPPSRSLLAVALGLTGLAAGAALVPERAA